MKIGVGPVSFGVYQADHAGVLPPDRLVGAMAGLGYDGAELPPAGYAGPPGAAVQLYERHGLTPVGIYIPIHFADPRLQKEDEARMEQALGELSMAKAGPRIAILADEGSTALLRHPGRGDDPTHALTPEAFRRLTDTVNRMADHIRRQDLTPSFHPHISTYVESPSEVERLLQATDIHLAFDTGHIALGGGDILRCWEKWRDRINHVHLKDVRTRVMEQAKVEGRRDFESWWPNVSVPLGTGDLPLQQFLATLRNDLYQGWVVVEQDRAPVASLSSLQAAIATEASNLRWVRRAASQEPGAGGA